MAESDAQPKQTATANAFNDFIKASLWFDLRFTRTMPRR
jgi:hypothetical protein